MRTETSYARIGSGKYSNTFDKLKESKEYRLRTKIDNGEMLTFEEECYITEKVNTNSLDNRSIIYGDWIVPFDDVVQKYSFLDKFEKMREHYATSYKALVTLLKDLHPTYKFANMVIVLSGKKRVGKDTVADILEKYLGGSNFERFSIASYLKRGVAALVNKSQSELEKGKDVLNISSGVTPRDLYKSIGDLIRDSLGKTFFINTLIEEVFKSQKKIVVISDMRYRHEYEELKKLDPVFIRIKNKNLPKDDHTSETDLDSIPDSEFNYVIDNEGTISDLENKVLEIIKESKND